MFDFALNIISSLKSLLSFCIEQRGHNSMPGTIIYTTIVGLAQVRFCCLFQWSESFCTDWFGLHGVFSENNNNSPKSDALEGKVSLSFVPKSFLGSLQPGESNLIAVLKPVPKTSASFHQTLRDCWENKRLRVLNKEFFLMITEIYIKPYSEKFRAANLFIPLKDSFLK